MKLFTTVGILVTFFVGAGAVEAYTLASGPLQSDTFLCDIVNVGPSTIPSVRLEIVNSFTADVLESKTCTNVEPNTECVVSFQYNNAVRAFCAVSATASANQLRGSLRAGDNLFELR